LAALPPAGGGRTIPTPREGRSVPVREATLLRAAPASLTGKRPDASHY
jgi:hypothetical protein